MQNHWNLASKQFEKAFEENTFGHTCGVCDRFWFQKDLRHTKKQFIIDLLKSEFPFDKVEEFIRRYAEAIMRIIPEFKVNKDVPITISGDFNMGINKDPSIIQFLKEELNLDYMPTSSPTTLGNTTIEHQHRHHAVCLVL
jgi:hypothetical protein